MRSDGDSPAPYNAFDPDLQLWVAACLYYGAEEVYERVYGPLEGDLREAFYQQRQVFGTTLQVTANAWPSDRDAFRDYWNHQVENIMISDEIREFLLGVAKLGYAPAGVQKRYGPTRFRLTVGYLPPPFRDALRVSWTPADQDWFDGEVAKLVARERRTPLWLSQLGFRVLLWDVRMRYRLGRRLV